MTTPEREAALAADQVSRDAFKAWQAAPSGPERAALLFAYNAANAEARRLWDIVGSDPLISQLHRAQEVTDAEEGHVDGEG